MKCSPRKEMAMGMMYGGEAKKKAKGMKCGGEAKHMNYGGPVKKMAKGGCAVRGFK